MLTSGDGAAPSSEPPAQPGFRGANPVAYRIDSNGVLRKGSDGLAAGSVFASGANPLVQIAPQWFNAPTFFVGQSKPSAFCKLGMTQRKALAPMVNQLTWSMTFSLLTAADQDVSSQSFTLSPQDAAKLSNIPLPAGRGQLACRMYAYVGGDPGKTFKIISNTIKTLQGAAGGASGQTFLSIPAADAIGIAQAEALFQQLVQGFAPPKWSQHWMNTNLIEVATTTDAATANAGALRLAYGTNTIVIIPGESNPVDHVPGQPDAVNRYFQNVGTFVGKPQFQFAVNPSGLSMTGGTNPFDSIPYVALTIEVDNAPT
ncbi:MAG: hypothetical protein ABI182_05750 [Candidatus Baltobacteraceae bacterium]